MKVDYVKEWQKYGPKAASISANIINGRRRLNFLFNLMLRNGFYEKDAKKATKKMDKHNLLSGYAGAIYHRNAKDNLSALTKQEAVNFLHKVENDIEGLLFDIDEKHPDKSYAFKVNIGPQHMQIPCQMSDCVCHINDNQGNDSETDVHAIERLLGKILDDSLSNDKEINQSAKQKLDALSKWSDEKEKERLLTLLKQLHR